MRILTTRERYEMTAPWFLFAYDIQSPAPGDPMQTKRGPARSSMDPGNDPMGHLNERPYDYGTMVNNLVSHYNGANDGERKQGRLWYKAAHDLFHNFAKDNDITPERAVAYGSAFSPLTDWGDNVHHAQKFMLGYRPGDPDFSKHDWQTAHIDPNALQRFRDQNGRDPSHSDEDLHQLADHHFDKFKRGPSLNAQNDLSDPNARREWMDNIQHHGMDKILDDHAQQALATYKKPGHPDYNPAHAIRASGIKTLGGNIQKAKDLYHSPEDVAQMFKVLGGPKISHFTDNILDDTPISDEGYYQHPNGDWKQNKDLGGTIDSHHVRATSMPHGAWERKPYASKNPSTDHEYDVFNRGLLDATDHINSQEPDATKHITPKQLQATVWLKHKNDKDFFERQRNPETGSLISHEHELGGAQRPEDWQFAEKSYKSKGKGLGKGPSRAAALEPEDFHNMPPLWRKLFMSRQPQEWTELLEDYVEHHSPDEPPPPVDPGDPRMANVLYLADTVLTAAGYDPFEFAEAEGPHDTPWTGGQAELLREHCPYCHADPGEPCDPRCPTNHSESPRDWAMDTKAVGTPFQPGPQFDPMQRLNSVDDVLAYSAAVVKNSAPNFGPDWQRNIEKLRDETGGYSVRGDEPGPSSGFMVSLPGHERTMPNDQDLGPAAADYGKEHWDKMKDDPDLYQGGWGPKGDPEFFHDVSRHHDDLWDAASAAYDADQHGFYHHESGESPSPLEFQYKGTPGLHIPGARTASSEEVPECLLWI